MRKNWLFFGLSLLLAGFLLFVLRLINGRWINNPMNLLIIFSVFALALLIWGLVKKRKFLYASSGGVFLVAVLSYVFPLIGLKDNLTIFIINLILGIGILMYGVIKR